MTLKDTLDVPPLRAAIIGLGQVGSRFDEEPGRKSIWSHIGAYLDLPVNFELVGAVEINSENKQKFKTRCSDIPVFETVQELIKNVDPEVVSICTPEGSHGEVLFQLLESTSLKTIWCEKPLSSSYDEARSMIEACEAQNIQIIVSYNRRWMPLWQRALQLVQSGTIGHIRSIRIAMPNRINSVGSHAINLLMMFGGEIKESKSIISPCLEEDGELAISGLINFKSGAIGYLQVTGFKAQLIVEAEIIGDDGRLVVNENRDCLTIEKFSSSEKYAGYNELGEVKVETDFTAENFSPFVSIAQEIQDAIYLNVNLTSSGRAALETQKLVEALTEPK